MNSVNKLSVLAFVFVLSIPYSATAMGKVAAGAKNNQSAALELSTDEESTLLWIREEEKIARDVYLTLYQQWSAPIFANIAESEQSHMDAVLRKIELFGLEDPALPGVGEFSSDLLQNLYDDLIAQGSLSYIDALVVGATIEDMDIMDLQDAIEQTSNLALQTTYASLLEGSKDHLRSFVALLQELGVEYQPQYIDQELFEAIIGY